MVAALNAQLECALPYPAYRLADTSTRRGKASSAPLPWFTGAAWLILELHAESRAMEARLRDAAGQPARPRGGSSENTMKALEAVVAVSHAVDDKAVTDCCEWLTKWCNRARIILGEKDEPRRLPRSPGNPEPRCPWCKHCTLRFWSLEGIVRCINPVCKDEDDKKPRGRIEISKFTGEISLIWQDGLVGVAA